VIALDRRFTITNAVENQENDAHVSRFPGGFSADAVSTYLLNYPELCDAQDVDAYFGIMHRHIYPPSD
jgi:hypothetical protein